MQTLHLVLAAASVLWVSGCEGASLKFCGRDLSNMMSKVCRVYNSPAWDAPTVVEQPATVVRRRRRRQVGIADECCKLGCTLNQLKEYCFSANTDSPLDGLETHMIADRSAEEPEKREAVPSVVVTRRGIFGSGRKREVGRTRRRCWCHRRRRAGRRRGNLMGNMIIVRNAVRAAPVVGTVSPLLTWGRTLNTDVPQPQIDRERYTLIAS